MALKMNKQKWIILILTLITAAAVTVTLTILLRPDTALVLSPDYAPQATDSGAQPLGDEGDDKLSQPEGGGAVSITYSTQATVSLADKTAAILFQNPTRSNQDIVLQIVIQDAVVAQSGILPPGYKLKSISLMDTARLKAGTYEGKFNVLYYDKASGEKAVLNTEIPINITVI